ncbi:MAG: TonB-dependent receptor [Acidobacteriota bacterium]
MAAFLGAAAPAEASPEPETLLVVSPDNGGDGDSGSAATIEGVVRDESGDPVAGAVISLAGTNIQLITGDDGEFRIEGLESGDYLLEAVGPFGGTAVFRVDAPAGKTAEVEATLELSHIRDELVVTGSPFARSSLELASPTNVLSGDELSFRLDATLGETLNGEAGVSSSYFAPGASRPVIRGLGGDRVAVLTNGIETGDVSTTSVDHAVTEEPLAAERIEILRGPAALLYGTTAVGGVVNVIDNRIPLYRATKPVEGYVELRGGSVADERAGVINLNGGSGDWAYNVGVAIRDSDDVEIPGFAESEAFREQEEEEEGHDEDEDEGHEEEEEAFGILENSAIESEQFTAGFTRFFGDRGSLGISVSGFDTLYGIPGGHGHHEEEGHDEDDDDDDHHDEDEDEGHDEEEEEEDVTIDMESRRVDLRGTIEDVGNFAGLNFRFGAVDYEHTEFEGEEVGTVFTNDSWEGRLELVQKQRGDWNGSFGLQLRNRDLEAVGEEAFIPPVETENLGIFTFQEVKRGDVRYQFGARFETQDSDANAEFGNLSRDFDGLSGSFGIVYQPREAYSVAASLARSVKLPNGEELFANGFHVATNTFEIGDPNLDEETTLGLDFGVRKHTGPVTGEISFFYNQISDFIFLQFTGEEEEDAPVTIYRQQDADFWGAELEARVALFESGDRHLDLELFSDFVRAEFDSGGDVPRIPPFRFGAGLHYHGGGWTAVAEARRVDEQDRIGENELPTEAYTLINASLGYRFSLGNQLVDVMVRGRNLSDEDARVHASFVKDQVPLPGRDISLAVKLWF